MDRAAPSIPQNLRMADEPVEALSHGGRWVNIIAWGLIFLGMVARLRLYLGNQSLWRDEAKLALNITQRSFSGLFRPLDYDQGAPIGFLMIEKCAVNLFGGGELVLRFWPMLASILTLPLFYFLCRRLLSPRAAIFALAILTLAADNSFHIAEAKQYSTDLFVAVGLLLLAARSFGGDIGYSMNTKSLLLLAIAGAAAVWFSHPAIFVLGGIGAALAVSWFGQTPRRGTGGIVILAAVWIGSFLANYLVSLRGLTHSDYLQHFWAAAGAYAPLPASGSAIFWYKRKLYALFANPFSAEGESLAVLLFLLGIAAIYRTRKPLVAMLLLPILAALGASAIHKYPFDSRLVLFVFPLTAIAVAVGLNVLWESRFRAAGILALGLLMISPVNRTLTTLATAPKNCEIRESMAFIAQHRKPGDVFYLSPSARYGFAFYQAQFGLDGVPVVFGSPEDGSLDSYAAELSAYAGKRVWVLVEDQSSGDPVGESEFIMQQPKVMDVMDSIGKCLWKAEPFNEYVACYDLTKRLHPRAGLSWLDLSE
jgi:Dolichyl-phosphate-mannose-protein mannosyltransferase